MKHSAKVQTKTEEKVEAAAITEKAEEGLKSL